MMRNNTYKKGFGIILSFALAFTVLNPAGTAKAAQNGPYNGKNTGGSIRISTHEADWGGRATYVYASTAVKQMLKENGNGTVGTVKGASYNKKTNTLTLKNFNHPTFEIETTAMGSNFKIKLVGKNSAQLVRSFTGWTDNNKSYISSISFTGKGSLIVNKNKKSWNGNGIIVNAEYTKSKLSFAKTCTVTAYCNKAAMQDENGKVSYTGDKGDAISLNLSSLKKNAISSKGKLSKKVTVTKVNAESGLGYNYVIAGNPAYSKKK